MSFKKMLILSIINILLIIGILSVVAGVVMIIAHLFIIGRGVLASVFISFILLIILGGVYIDF